MLPIPVLLLAAFAPRSQDDLAEVNRIGREVFERVREAGSEGNGLAVLDVLEALGEEYDSPVAAQVVGLHRMQLEAELGDYAAALRTADTVQPGRPAFDAAREAALEECEPSDAVAAIVELARDETVVMVNEAHHQPQHRALTLELLHALRPLGFTHFAAETLTEADTELNERGYPIEKTGPYIDEPLYGDLVRTALALGYVVVPYESIGGRDRELGQATNLIQRVLEQHDDARLLVHAGYAHINETGLLAGTRAMAGQFKELTGIDPLTVDQTRMSERASAAFEIPFYGRVVEELALERPTVFRAADGTPWTLEPGVRDVTVVHPRSVYEHGRPTWLRAGGLRRVQSLAAAFLGDAGRVVVEARLASEPAEAIPVDRIVAVAGEPLPALLLPAGELVLEARDAAGELVHTERVVVD